jgi:hypothetical protein
MLWHKLNSKFSLPTNIGKRHIGHTLRRKRKRKDMLADVPLPAPVSLFPTTGKSAVFFEYSCSM